jgi:hypothetical protein
MTVLKSKYPDARIPDAAALLAYPTLPNFVDLNITKDSIKAGRRATG